MRRIGHEISRILNTKTGSEQDPFQQDWNYAQSQVLFESDNRRWSSPCNRTAACSSSIVNAVSFWCHCRRFVLCFKDSTRLDCADSSIAIALSLLSMESAPILVNSSITPPNRPTAQSLHRIDHQRPLSSSDPFFLHEVPTTLIGLQHRSINSQRIVSYNHLSRRELQDNYTSMHPETAVACFAG